MNNNNDTNTNRSSPSLRRRAESKTGPGLEPVDSASLSPEETQRLLHELEVHRIELEMQNEELLRTQAELEASRARYFDLYDLAPVGYVTISQKGLILETNLTAATILDVGRSTLVNQSLANFIHPEDQDIYYFLHKHLFTTGMRQTGELRLRRTGNIPFWVQLEMTIAEDDEGAPVSRTVISDISARKHTEASLREQVETRDREQTLLLEISQTLASTLELQPGLILSQLKGIIEFTHGGLFALKDHTLVALAMRGTFQMEQAKIIRIHLKGPEILAELFKNRQPVCIPDIWNEDPEARFLRSLMDDGAAVLLAGMQSWMWVPLEVKHRIIGSLGVAHWKRNFFTPHHASLALSVAHKAAITMVNVELNARAQELAVMEERQRLARNLHDAINQSLFSAGLIAEVLPRLWERDQDDARQSINDLIRLTRGAQAEMRALLAELRPATLTDSNLNDLLQLLGSAFSGRTNTLVIHTGTDEIILPAEVQITFYRICQEGLNNVAKHSQATQVDIELLREGPRTTMYIRDNGNGFDPGQNYPGHYGLSMMQERASAVGAQFSITSQPGQGTVISLSWASGLP